MHALSFASASGSPVTIGFLPTRAGAQKLARHLSSRPASDAGSVASDYRAQSLGVVPTIVTTETVYGYLDALDGDVNALGQSLDPATLARQQADFAARWTSFLTRWKAFFTTERAETHYLDARATMGAIDGFYDELEPLDREARAHGAAPATPPVLPPPSGGGFGLGLGAGALLTLALALALLR